MKNDLITSIAIAIFGVFAGYFVCNMFSGQSSPYSFYSVDVPEGSLTLDEPNPEIFNYRALNPTVEVYVGDCRNFDESGQCIDDSDSQIKGDIIVNDDNPEEDVEEVVSEEEE